MKIRALWCAALAVVFAGELALGENGVPAEPKDVSAQHIIGQWRQQCPGEPSRGKGANWGRVYRTDTAGCPPEVSKRELVVPGKRWEASREGVEDYAYLHLLKQALSNRRQATGSEAIEAGEKLLAFWPERVLEAADNPLLADRAKKEVIEAIVDLSRKRRDLLRR